MKRHQRAIIVAVAAATLGTAGVAGAELSTPTVTHRFTASSDAGAQAVSAPDPATANVLSALRVQRDASDVVPANLVDWRAKEQGASAATSRRLEATTDGSSYIVAASGGACLVSSSFVVSGCATDADISSGTDIQGVVCSPYMDPTTLRIYGLLPDGSSAFTVDHKNGTHEAVPIVRNFVDYTGLKSASPITGVHWTGPDGPHSDDPLPADAGSSHCDTTTTPAQARSWAAQHEANAPSS